MQRVNRTSAVQYVADREEFQNHTGSLRGKSGGATGSEWGSHLPPTLRNMPSLRGAEYVVYSYATPIAWFFRGVWFVPDVRYSMTTSHHQSVTSRGITLSGRFRRNLSAIRRAA